MKNRQGHSISLRPPSFWWGWALALGMTAFLVLLATLPPFVGPRLRVMLMQAFSNVCHQIPARSPSIDGVTLAVCHRCYAIYWGLPLAALGYLALMRWESFLGDHARYILLAALLPATIDWLLGLLGLWQNTPLSRTLTGGFFGFVAGLYVARALAQVFRAKTSMEKPTSAIATVEQRK